MATNVVASDRACFADQYYIQMAEQSSEKAKEKEAASAYLTAERHLNVDEDHINSLSAAQKAHAMFKTLGNARGESDALRLVAYAHHLRAETLRSATKSSGEVVEAARDEAEAVASKGLEEYRKSGDKRSIGVMLLSLAELSYNRANVAKREEAFLAAVEARGFFQELSDTKLEAAACFVLANIYAQKGQLQEARGIANEALGLFRKLGDRKGEGKSLNLMATVYLREDRVQDAFAAAQESLQIFRDLDLSKLLACGLHNLATWCLNLRKPGDAVPHAREALKIFEELHYEKCWQAAAMNLLSHALVDSGDIVQGLKVAKDGMIRFENAGDTRGKVFALDALARAYLRKDEHDEALVAAETGLAICRELGDKKWEEQMLLTLSQVHHQSKSWEKAIEAVENAKALSVDDAKAQAALGTVMMQVHVAKEDFRSAVLAAEDEMDNALQAGDRSKEARALLALASIRGMDGDLKPAHEHAKQALELFRELNETAGEGKAQLMLADIHLAKGEFAEGLASANKCLEIFKAMGNLKLQSEAWKKTAELRMAEDKAPEIAVKAANEAVSLMKKFQDNRGEAELLIIASQAQIKVAIKESNTASSQDAYRVMSRGGEKALKLAQDAVKLGKKLKENGLIASAVYQCAQSQMVAYRVKQALALADDALARFTALDDRSGQLASRILRAEILASDGKEEGAREILNQAMTTAKTINDDFAEYRAWEVLQHLDRGKKKPVEEGAGVVSTTGAAAEGAAAVADEAPGLDPAVVEKMVTETANNAIGGDELALDSPLMDNGMDSLSSVAFRNDLQRTVGFNLPAALIFDYPTARQIVDHLVEISKTKKK